MMNFRRPKTVLGNILVLCLCLFIPSVLFPVFAAEVERPALVGEVAYAEPMKFDYTQDGKPNNIQLWVAFDIKPAQGKEGEPGYITEEGYIRRYMKDIALGVPVIGYSQFNMLPDNPIGDKVPASEIQLTGNTATFMSGGLHYTVVDGGEGIASDSIVVNDGIRKYPVTLIDGDITISNKGK